MIALIHSNEREKRRADWTSDVGGGWGRLDVLLSFNDDGEPHPRVSQLHAALTWNPRID